MTTSDLEATAEQYFSSNNFLSKRILEDITTVRESYEEAWEGLEQKEREQVINEHIILPEVMIQHSKVRLIANSLFQPIQIQFNID